MLAKFLWLWWFLIVNDLYSISCPLVRRPFFFPLSLSLYLDGQKHTRTRVSQLIYIVRFPSPAIYFILNKLPRRPAQPYNTNCQITIKRHHIQEEVSKNKGAGLRKQCKIFPSAKCWEREKERWRWGGYYQWYFKRRDCCSTTEHSLSCVRQKKKKNLKTPG